MIVIRTPLRFSFFGGGTDVPSYYKKNYGCVLGQSIDKYVYVIVNRRFEIPLRISYLKNEIVSNPNKIKHDIIRESLKHFKISKNTEIVTVADVPGTGTGLGSSSSLTVSLCNALSIYKENPLDKNRLAELACNIEIEKVKSPIGKQDQYFATFGGLLFMRFDQNRVTVERLNLRDKTLRELEENLIAFYTGISRKSNKILSIQKQKMLEKISLLDKLRSLAEEGRDYLRNNDLSKFSELFNKNWEIKKQLSSQISNPFLDKLYKKALRAGAVGGKISGAGGGGFMLLYCEPKYQKKVKTALRGFAELPFSIDNAGTIQLH